MFAPMLATPQAMAAERATTRRAHPTSTLMAQGATRYGAAEHVLFLQRAIGNQATLRRAAHRASGLTDDGPGADTRRIQAKLVVGEIDDPLEHEADRAADQVMRMPDPELSIMPAAARPSRTSACCDADEAIRRNETGQHAGGGEVPAVVQDVLRAPGEPLDAITRAYFEPRFGRDLADVRVSADATAARSAAAVGARAYTVGDRIAFAGGEYAPATQSGRSLLAHELAHVIQQGGGGPPARPDILRRAPDKYDGLTIDQLRKLVKQGDKAAAEALYARYEAMRTGLLAQYARGSDEIARDVYAKRTVPPRAAAGQGNFSKPGMQETLANDIRANRAATGIPRTEPSAVTPEVEVEGGTVGAARTDIPGLESRAFVGQSKRAGGPGHNPQSSFPPAADVKDVPQTFGHAEQHIADQLEEALARIPREQLQGRTVWMLIEQEVCATCGQGAVNLDTAAGVLKKLSQKYPELTFEVKNLQSSALIVLKGTGKPAAAAGGARPVENAPAGGGESVEAIETPRSVAPAAGEEVAEVAGTSGLRIAGEFLAREAPGLILQTVIMLLFPPSVHIHEDKAADLIRTKFDPAFQDALGRLVPAINKLHSDDPSRSIYAIATARFDYSVDATSSGDLEVYLNDVTFAGITIADQTVLEGDPQFQQTGSLRVARQVRFSVLLYETEATRFARAQQEYEECVREYGTGSIPPAAGVEAAQTNPEEGPCIPPHMKMMEGP